MQSKASTPKAYIAELPEDRKEPIRKFRKVILDNRETTGDYLLFSWSW